MSLKNYLILLIAGLMLLMVSACDENTRDTYSYSGDVEPIFVQRDCKFCHTSDQNIHLDLTNHAGLMRGSDNGVVVVPGDADHSLLYLKVAMEQPPRGERMPLGRTPLTATQIRIIEDWINTGAQNN